jgi:serine/threonine protein kinase
VADSRLIEVAAAVAEGSAIDWSQAEESANDASERAAIRELQVVAQMGEAIRSPRVTPSTATPRSAAQLRVGEAWGHLRISEAIGEGSFGSVYRAWDTRLECEVALKLIKASGVSHAFDLSRALKEARLLARVRHNHVVRVYGADAHSDRFGLWMELIPGRTLEQMLAIHGPMGVSEAIPVGIDLCHALAAVHGAGLLHRDIKAHNVVREEGGRIVLMDFGTGRHIGGAREVADSLAGTPLYLAPELFAGMKPSVRSDIYSVGVLLYHLVTDDYPVSGRTRGDVEAAHVAATRQPLRDVRPDLPSSFIEVVERALARNPADRYPSAGEFGNALAAVSGQPDSRVEPSNVTRLRKSLLGLAAVIVAGLLVGLGMFGRSVRPPDGAAAPAAAAGSRESVALSSAAAMPSSASGAYNVAASFYASRDGLDVPLAQGSRVKPGDKLFATVDASQPVFVYIVNRDEAGQSFLLFPLPGLSTANPLPTEHANRLPGMKNGQQHYWEVTSAGGREHFFVYVTPHRLIEFEQILTALPRAEVGRTVSMPLSVSAIGLLRGVGGLSAVTSSSHSTPAELADLQPLRNEHESVQGVWARRVSFENPAE